MKDKTIGDWIGIFRVIGELKNSCREAEDNLNIALEQISKVSKHVKSLDGVLMHKYNIESTPKEKSND